MLIIFIFLYIYLFIYFLIWNLKEIILCMRICFRFLRLSVAFICIYDVSNQCPLIVFFFCVFFFLTWKMFYYITILLIFLWLKVNWKLDFLLCILKNTCLSLIFLWKSNCQYTYWCIYIFRHIEIQLLYCVV